MPISGAKDYLSTLDAFAAHWTLVNTNVAPTPFALQGSYVAATLAADRAALNVQLAAVEAAANNAQAASADRDIKRAAIGERMRQFNQTVRGLLPGSIYVSMLPRIPSIAAAPGLWMRAMDEMAHAWNRINTDAPPPPGITLPLVLNGNYGRSNFVTEQTALATAFTQVANTRTNAEAARVLRDQIFQPVRARLIQYRAAVQGRFPVGNALIASIPALTPARGSTPAAVAVGGMWDATVSKARITYAASVAATLESYQLRACFGTTYRTDEETVIATNPLNTLVFLTDEGLVASGSSVIFRVYVTTTTGNEKGSRNVKIVRP